MSFPRYPKYKTSGVEWAGQIPEPWTPTRLRFLLRDGYDGMKIGPFGSQLTSDMLDESGTYKVYGQENVIANDFTRGSRFIGDDKFHELAVYEIIPGDLLITMMGTSGRCDVAPSTITRGIMDSHLLRMRTTNSVTPPFARLLIDEAAYVKMQIQLAGKGTIMHGLNSSIVKDLLFFVPSFNEQAAILEFLDRETGKIDELVAEQRRLMELLKEKRQAVISHAVTKGLNPHAPMKPSGIEWLGDVPEGWEVGGMTKYISSLVDYRGRTPTKVDEGVFLLTARNIRGGKLDYITSQEFIPESEYEDVMRRGKPEVGDVLFTTEAPLGQVANIDRTDVALAQRVIKFRGQAGILDNYFLKYWLIGSFAQADMERLATGSTALGLKGSKVVQLRLCLPPINEQVAIVTFLDAELAKFDTLTAEAQRAIDLLQERRTALISAAVTGQIDVRESVV